MADKKKFAKAKKMSSKGLSEGPKRPRSSRGLRSMSNREAARRKQQAKNKYGDKGMAGYEMEQRIADEAIDQAIKEKNAFDYYEHVHVGEEEIKQMAHGGAARGVGKAQRGFGKATYSDKLI
tara:strand:- start:12889 stop:13254 length:366 start_codon:yes stop_codon:yes gene_type:complete